MALHYILCQKTEIKRYLIYNSYDFCKKQLIKTENHNEYSDCGRKNILLLGPEGFSIGVLRKP